MDDVRAQELIENFELFDDWEERYQYLIDLGKQLPAMNDRSKTDANKVEGCVSQVWMVADIDDNARFQFVADSDAAIVRGLIGVLRTLYNDRDPREIDDIDIEAMFARMGLENHLSPNRRNGFFSMVARIHELAGQYQYGHA